MSDPWICPKCSTANAPWMGVCGNPNCGSVTWTTGTHTLNFGKDAKCSYCGGLLWVCRGSHAVS